VKQWAIKGDQGEGTENSRDIEISPLYGAKPAWFVNPFGLIVKTYIFGLSKNLSPEWKKKSSSWISDLSILN
jgi:hypothetical protein